MKEVCDYIASAVSTHLSLRARLFVVVALAILLVPLGSESPASAAQLRNGPAACSSGNPPSPYKGYCGTYGGKNTWYGTYGLGFPGTLGWVLCANTPSNAGAYPSPSYAYTATTAPAAIRTSGNVALGFALSEAAARGWVTGGNPGQFSANELGAAMRILSTEQWWSTPTVTMEPGLTRAYNALRALLSAATDSTATPTVSITVSGGDTTFTTSTALTGRLTFPGSGRPLAGTTVKWTVSGATFSSAGGPTTLSTATDAAGRTTVTVVNTGASVHPITISAVATVGQRNITFLRPTIYVPSAQIVGAAPGATRIARSLSVNSGVPTGTISLEKQGDAGPYLDLSGAEFDVIDGAGQVVDTLTTSSLGLAGPTEDLPIGTYTVRETTPPWGYVPAPDQTVTVTAGATTLVSLTGALIEQSTRAELGITKIDATTKRPLVGATFHLERDPLHTGNFSEDIGTCTTVLDGTCPLSGATSLLAGDYRLTETAAPPGYHLPEDPIVYVTLIPGEVRMVTFADDAILVALPIDKRNASQPGVGVPGAVYDLYAVDPGPLGGPLESPPSDATSLAGATWYARATTAHDGTLVFLVPVGVTWCVVEHSSPPGFLLDPAVRCTGGPLTKTSAPIVIDESEHLVTLSVEKYNSDSPGTGVPGAVYDLFVEGAIPAGYAPPPVPTVVEVPAGYHYFGAGITDQGGALHFRVPSGQMWCVRERTAPPNYVLDHALRCTSQPLIIDPGPTAVTLAVPEIHTPPPKPPVPPVLPETGFNSALLMAMGSALGVVGLLVLLASRKLERRHLRMLRTTVDEE